MKRLSVLAASALLVGFASIVASHNPPPQTPARLETRHILVKFRTGIPPISVNRGVRAWGLRTLSTVPKVTVRRAANSPGGEVAMVEAIFSNPDMEFTESSWWSSSNRRLFGGNLGTKRGCAPPLEKHKPTPSRI